MDINNINKQGKKVTIFAIILSAISIAVLVFGFSLVSSDKVVILQSISNLHNKYSKFSSEEQQLINKLATSKDIGIKSNISVEAQDEKVNIITNYLENKDDKKSKLDLNINYNSEELLNGTIAMVENKVYAFIKDITPKYYYSDYDFTSVISNMKIDSYEKIFTLFKEAITDSIGKNEIKKEKVTIKYKGKDKKVNKLSYNITTKEVEEILTNFIKSIKNDKTLFNEIVGLIGVSSDDVSKGLDDLLKEIHSQKEENILAYNTYYYGFNKIVQYELVSLEEKVTLQYKVEDKEYLNIIQDEKVLLSLEIAKNKDTYEFVLTFNNPMDNKEYKITGTYKNNILDVAFNYMGTTLKANIILNNSNKENTYSYDIKATIKAGIAGFEMDVLKINWNLEYYFNQKVDIDLTDSTEFNNMTVEELNTIYENFKNSKLYAIIGSFIEENSLLFDFNQFEDLIPYYEG